MYIIYSKLIMKYRRKNVMDFQKIRSFTFCEVKYKNMPETDYETSYRKL